jgi:hypothetical protein
MSTGLGVSQKPNSVCYRASSLNRQQLHYYKLCRACDGTSLQHLRQEGSGCTVRAVLGSHTNSHYDCPSFGERIGCRYDVNHSGQLSYIEFVRGIYAQEKAWGIRSEETERQVVPSSVAHDLIDCNAVSSRAVVAMRRAAALGSRCGA